MRLREHYGIGKKLKKSHLHDTDGSFFAESKCTNKAILLNKVAEKSGFALEAVTFECVVNY